MPILQYQCQNCNSIFEHLVNEDLVDFLSCISCGSAEIQRAITTYLYPNKKFCPHDKDLDSEYLRTQLGGIMKDQSLRCGGCGVDGAKGNCGTGSAKRSCACGAGGCGSC